MSSFTRIVSATALAIVAAMISLTPGVAAAAPVHNAPVKAECCFGP